jgi:hypothetical protein
VVDGLLAIIECMKHRYLNKHNAFWLTVELLVLWVLASPPIAKPWYDSLLFQPWLSGGSTAISEIAGVQKQTLTIPTKSGVQISAWYFKVADARKTPWRGFLSSTVSQGCLTTPA